MQIVIYFLLLKMQNFLKILVYKFLFFQFFFKKNKNIINYFNKFLIVLTILFSAK